MHHHGQRATNDDNNNNATIIKFMAKNECAMALFFKPVVNCQTHHWPKRRPATRSKLPVYESQSNAFLTTTTNHQPPTTTIPTGILQQQYQSFTRAEDEPGFAFILYYLLFVSWQCQHIHIHVHATHTHTQPVGCDGT
jgi:hypothetical protein